ncbi:hypothetical protein F5051DRAFT_476462 [Lentinula edodes]|nr:hypothetical protein F5051DRAFT_476462 [Lentinula edodes]
MSTILLQSSKNSYSYSQFHRLRSIMGKEEKDQSLRTASTSESQSNDKSTHYDNSETRTRDQETLDNTERNSRRELGTSTLLPAYLRYYGFPETKTILSMRSWESLPSMGTYSSYTHPAGAPIFEGTNYGHRVRSVSTHLHRSTIPIPRIQALPPPLHMPALSSNSWAHCKRCSQPLTPTTTVIQEFTVLIALNPVEPCPVSCKIQLDAVFCPWCQDSVILSGDLSFNGYTTKPFSQIIPISKSGVNRYYDDRDAYNRPTDSAQLGVRQRRISNPSDSGLAGNISLTPSPSATSEKTQACGRPKSILKKDNHDKGGSKKKAGL